MGERLTFCIDAGATRSRGRLYGSGDAPLAAAESGPANASYDREQAVASVTALWRQAAGEAGHDPEQVSTVTLAIGGAGLFIAAARDAFVAQLPRFGTVVTMSDGYAAMIGAGRGQPCALVTIGTGVAGHRLFADGCSIQRDAWGWIVGDRGGGAWLGTRAVRHLAAVRDGLAPSSTLARAVLGQAGGPPGLRAGALSGLDGRRLAAFAPLVFEAEAAGCPVATAILARAVRHLTDLATALHGADVPLFLSGGLAAAMRPRLVAAMGRDVLAPAGDAMEGCLRVARGEAPPERVVVD